MGRGGTGAVLAGAPGTAVALGADRNCRQTAGTTRRR